MIKLSVNAIQIEMVCLQAPFGIFDFGPKKLPGPSRNGSLENSLEAIKPMENFKLFSQTNSFLRQISTEPTAENKSFIAAEKAKYLP